MADPKTNGKTIPLWDKRIEAMRAKHTTPRDIYERDILKVSSRSSDVTRNVRFLWISDIMLKKKPMLTGFSWHLYQPVTQKVAEEFELELETNDVSPEGVYRAGADANLYWAPEKLCQEQDRVMRGEPFVATSKHEEERLDGEIRSMGAEPVGEVVHTKDERTFQQAADRSREGMNRDLLESMKDKPK